MHDHIQSLNRCSRNCLLWALGFKLLLFFFFAWQFAEVYPRKTNFLFVTNGDTEGYFAPIRHFVQGHGYSIADGKGNYKPYTDRIPGLLPIYAPLYFIGGEKVAQNGFIVIQLITSCVALVAFYYLLGMAFASRWVQVVGTWLYAGSSFMALLDHYGQSDSLAISFLLISLSLFVRGWNEKSGKRWFQPYRFLGGSGVLLAWAICIRPVTGIFFACMVCFLVWKGVRRPRFYLKTGLLFVTPVCLVLVSWTLRNYIVLGKIIPLQTPYTEMIPPQTWLLNNRLIPMLGEDFQPWTSHSAGQWFYCGDNPQYQYKKHVEAEAPFAARDFTPEFTFDSLLVLRQNYQLSLNKDLSPGQQYYYQQQALEGMNHYIASFRTHQPFRYYFLSYVEMTVRFLFVRHLGLFPFPKWTEMTLYQKGIKMGYILFYNLIVLTGLFGFLLLLRLRKSWVYIGIGGIIGYISLITVYYFCREHRYFTMVYPFFVMTSSYFVITIGRFTLAYLTESLLPGISEYMTSNVRVSDTPEYEYAATRKTVKHPSAKFRQTA